jgi:Fur family transcriptional regulator, ferric uptake regulator
MALIPMSAAQPSLTGLSLESILDLLRAHRMRITRSRIRIIQILLENRRPLSLQEIQRSATANAATPDYATVFRIMTLLQNLGLAQKVHLNRSCSYYELLNPQQHFDHIVCTKCGKVTVMVDSCPVEKVERKIEQKYGYSDIRHSLEFFGKCSECREPVAARS